jgi:hypothetical protein
MIVVCAQWQGEVMADLQGDFEEELRRMSVERACHPPQSIDRTPWESQNSPRTPARTGASESATALDLP